MVWSSFFFAALCVCVREGGRDLGMIREICLSFAFKKRMHNASELLSYFQTLRLLY